MLACSIVYRLLQLVSDLLCSPGGAIGCAWINQQMSWLADPAQVARDHRDDRLAQQGVVSVVLNYEGRPDLAAAVCVGKSHHDDIAAAIHGCFPYC
jgi:hypothetical protein